MHLSSNKIVDHSDVVEASSLGETERLDEKHLSAGIWCTLY